MKNFLSTLLFTLVLMLVCSFNVKAQASKQKSSYNEITLTIKQSLRIPHHLVVIHLEKYNEEVQLSILSKPMKGHEKEWMHTQMDTAYLIDASVFSQIENLVNNINSSDISHSIKNFSNGRDGKTCTLEFGNYQNAISYKIWSPNMLTSQRKLNDFLVACKEIIRLGGFSISDIL